MTSLSGPDVYTPGLGGVFRAHRKYIGLSVAEMASELRISLRSYTRIKRNQADCPPGLLDTISWLVTKFEDDVATALVDERLMFIGASEAWMRAMTDRASVEWLGE